MDREEGRQKEEARLSSGSCKLLRARKKKQRPLFLPICSSFFFFFFYPLFYSSLSIHYQSDPFISAPWVLMADGGVNSLCVCVYTGCSLPTDAEQSSVITQTLSWPSLLLSSTLNGGECVCVCVCEREREREKEREQACICISQSVVFEFDFVQIPGCVFVYLHVCMSNCVWIYPVLQYRRVCVCVCVKIADPSRGELLWMLFCSNYCYLFPLKQDNCSIAGRTARMCVRMCIGLFASWFIVCLCRTADPSHFFSMDTFSLRCQNSFCCSCRAANLTFFLPVLFYKICFTRWIEKNWKISTHETHFLSYRLSGVFFSVLIYDEAIMCCCSSNSCSCLFFGLFYAFYSIFL